MGQLRVGRLTDYLGAWVTLTFSIILTILPGHAAVVSTCDESSLRAAIFQGGTVTFVCDGTIVLSNTIIIGSDVALDGTGRNVAISGNNAVRLFQVLPGINFSLTNLTLSSGRADTGAAIYSMGGNILAVSCVFSNNAARGTNGAPSAVGNEGGPARGGAIASELGQVRVNDCQFAGNTARGGDAASGQFTGRAGGPGSGGAIYNNGGALQIEDTTFFQNSVEGGPGSIGMMFGPGPGGAAGGGGIFSTGGSLNLRRSTFDLNSVRGGAGAGGLSGGVGGLASGGAVALQDSPANASDSVFSRNSSVGGLGGRLAVGGMARGAAISCEGGSANLTDCSLSMNQVSAGGGQPEGVPAAEGRAGGFFHSGTSLVLRVLFQLNTTTGAGASRRPQNNPGGPGNGGGIYNSGALTVLQSAFVDNAAFGGPGSVQEGTFNPPVFKAGGDGSGGGIYNAGDLRVINTTFAENEALRGIGAVSTSPPATGPAGQQYGGAIFNASAASTDLLNTTIARNGGVGGAVHTVAAPFLIQNSIVALNDGADCAGQVTDGGNNISSGSSCAFGPGSRNNTDPQLAPLANNGASTPTFALLPNSPALNNATSNTPTVDQRGVSRPQGVHADIGAYEAQAHELRSRLRIESAPTDNVTIHLVGRLATPYILQGSPNLSAWTAVATNTTDANGRTIFLQPRSAPAQFYRAME